MKDLIGIVGFLALLPLVVEVVRRLALRFDLPAEVRRKAVHVGMGASALSFPWVFESVISVAILGALCLLVLHLIRKRESRRADPHSAVLHGVGRNSLGDVFFPVAVTIVFAMASRHQGTPGILLYVVPILILTVADATGALVGTRYGEHRFTSLSGWKSAEGCISFFLAAFFSAHLPLLLFSEIDREETLLISVILGLTVTLFEAISTRGIDNLVVPIASALLLDRFLPLEAFELSWRLIVVAGLLGMVLSLRGWTRLEGGALLAATLFGYGCCALGDWRFLVPPIILFVEHLYLSRRLMRLWPAKHDLTSVLAIGLSLLPWPILAGFHPPRTEEFLVPFIVGTATHLAVSNTCTRAQLARRSPTLRMAALGSIKGVTLIVIPSLLLVGEGLSTLAPGFAAGAAGTFIVATVFSRFARAPGAWESRIDRWCWQAGLATFASTIAWLTLSLT